MRRASAEAQEEVSVTPASSTAPSFANRDCASRGIPLVGYG